jgi:hypothetical protein
MRTRLTSTAENRKATAAAPNTTSTLVAARSRPPMAGPPKIPRLSKVLDVTLAAVSSAGLVAREGRSAACAGRTAE